LNPASAFNLTDDGLLVVNNLAGEQSPT